MKQRNFWTECYRPETEISPRICSSCTPLHKCPPYREIPAPNSRPRTVSRSRSPHDFSLPGGWSSLASRSFSRDKNSSTDRFLSDKRPFPPRTQELLFRPSPLMKRLPSSFSHFRLSSFPLSFPVSFQPPSLSLMSLIFMPDRRKKSTAKWSCGDLLTGERGSPFSLIRAYKTPLHVRFLFSFFFPLLLAQ